jgi:cytochrome P450
MEYRVVQTNGAKEIIDFRRDPIAYLSDISGRGLDIKHVSVGNHHRYFLNNPDLIREVLVLNGKDFTKGSGVRSLEALLGQGLVTSEGALHSQQRKLIQPVFGPGKLSGYVNSIGYAAFAMQEKWISGSTVVLEEDIRRLTIEIICRCMLGVEWKTNNTSALLAKALGGFQALHGDKAHISSLPFKVLAKWKFDAFRRNLDLILKEIVKLHQMRPECYSDMLSILLSTADGREWTRHDESLLLDEARTMLLAGHENTTNALLWTWFLIAEHPEVRQAIREESNSQIGSKLPGDIDLRRFRFTESVFKEALRLYPPAWIFARQAVTNCKLGPLAIPAGSTVFLSPFSVHRDIRFWDRPLEFRPQRWLQPGDAIRTPFSYFPFGAGTRGCIGEQFAMMEGVLILATISKNWVFDLAPGQQVELWPQVTLRQKKPLRFVALRV